VRIELGVRVIGHFDSSAIEHLVNASGFKPLPATPSVSRWGARNDRVTQLLAKSMTLLRKRPLPLPGGAWASR
jgi:hypothetical protein